MVKVMRKLRTVTLIFVTLILTLTLVKSTVVAQTPDEMQTFFDSEIPGLKIQVNATAETEPSQNITVALNLKPQTIVEVTYFNLSIFGFINGTYKTMIYTTLVSNFPFNDTFSVPEQVWGVTFGEITLTYNVTYVIQQGNIQTKTTITYENLKVGFDMTRVKNVYLETVEEQLKNLNSTFEQINQTFWQMFQMNLTAENLAQLNETYWSLKGSSNELGNTRTAVGVLAVTTVFFVATTLYLVMRKPRESW
jgi:hypothetical protein